ncbi:NAD(P)-dependent oxidoreductase [Acetobacter sp. AN02]|uniref:NAD(P)-dependent oxidoreductase n=1 Tax=Acetobacter sp. AN02 TaxID=2894186 RepID=UPI00243460D1|nr:NAD(P)-dependent oxidoreductase [Acetobacter sp. AN02]MDG6094038.1 NAD(P)-dependent oxidoreductase [Acetobacter sp. AN02]
MPIHSVGFVGYGAMASRMGGHLAKAGYKVCAYTPSGKSRDNSTPMLATPRAVAEASDAVIVCVPADDALRSSAYGEKGFFAGMSPGSLLINMSSVSPDTADVLRGFGEGREITVLDAPVSGSTPEADSASLVILAGGTAAEIARAQPLFDKIGRLTIHAGPPGAGSRLKLVINGIMGATLAAIAEAVGYGLGAGLDRAKLYDALEEMAVISPHHKRKLKAAKDRNFTPQFPTRLMQKDMRLLQDAAARLAVPMPTQAAATQMMSLARRSGADLDYSCLFRLFENKQ